MTKNKRGSKIYHSHGKSSYNDGFNLGKGQLDSLKKTSATSLTPQEKEEIKNDLLDWGYEYWTGALHLGKSSDPELKKLFPDLRRILVREGEVVVIRKKNDNEYCYLFADIETEKDGSKNVKKTLSGKIVDLNVKYRNRKDAVGKLVKEIEISGDFTPDDFVIFRNNSQSLPELRRGKRQLEKIVLLEEGFLKDLKVSRPRLIAYHPLIASKEKAKVLKDFIFEEANDLITIASKNEGDKPTLHDWPGGSKQADLWTNYIKCLTEWKRLNGIPTNTARKKERNLAGEVELVEDQFQASENVRYYSMIECLEECKEKWGWNYTLLRLDEEEKETIDLEIKQLEKRLKAEELKKRIRELSKNAELEKKQIEQDNTKIESYKNK